jgi:hypothetical protein
LGRGEGDSSAGLWRIKVQGQEIRESAPAKAHQIAEAELEALGWTVKDHY